MTENSVSSAWGARIAAHSWQKGAGLRTDPDQPGFFKVAAVKKLLWDEAGARRVPRQAAFDTAVSRLRRGRLEELCELGPRGPIYLIPTPPFLRALEKRLRALGHGPIVEVAAGDGHLTRALRARGLRVTATDSGAWERPEARMSARERRELRGTKVSGLRRGDDVLRLGALPAIRELRPRIVLASWLPPGPLLGKLIKAPVRYVLEIGAGSGVTGDLSCWRYPHEFCDELDAKARCRLDERPARELHTRVTLYLGAAHPDFREDRAHWALQKA